MDPFEHILMNDKCLDIVQTFFKMCSFGCILCWISIGNGMLPNWHLKNKLHEISIKITVSFLENLFENVSAKCCHFVWVKFYQNTKSIQTQILTTFSLLTAPCFFYIGRDSLWKHNMEILSTFLSHCEGNLLPVIGGLPSQRSSNMEFWCFLLTLLKNNSGAGDLINFDAHVMSQWCHDTLTFSIPYNQIVSRLVKEGLGSDGILCWQDGFPDILVGYLDSTSCTPGSTLGFWEIRGNNTHTGIIISLLMG